MIIYQNEHTTVFQSALYQTTSTVVLTKDMVLIVDPNWLPNELLVPGHGQVTTDTVEMKWRLDMSSDHLERLIKAVIAKDESAIAALGDEHAYKSSFTEECHEENIRIIAQEYSS